jgi:urease accessory protein
VLRDVERTAPFALGPPSYRRGRETAEVIVQQVGPGILPGDDLRVELVVGTGARLVVRGQGATRLYPCPDGTRATVRLSIRVEGGGELVFLPGELIPFRDAELCQWTDAEIGPGGRFALSEIVAPGRSAMGEAYAYRRLDLRQRISVDGRPVLVERSQLDPRRRPLDAPGRHGSFPVAGTLYLAGYESMPTLDLLAEARALIGVGQVGDVGIVRLLAQTTQVARQTFDSVVERIDRSAR